MKKYMFVVPTLANGGAERVVSVISSALTQCGAEATVAKYFETQGEYAVHENVRVINLSGGDQAAYARLGKLGLLRALRSAVKAEKPDYVIPFLFQVAQLTDLAVMGLPVTVIQSIRINPAVGPVHKWARILRDRLVYKSPCTFVQNEQQKQYFKASHRHKIHVLYNPVSEELFSAAPKTPDGIFTVCALGRLSNQKNFPLLIDAFQDAFADTPNARLQIYGEGDKKAQLQEYIDRGTMPDRIRLMGRTNDVKAAFGQADLFVLSSDWEGMPNALIEAMACHVPCISTDCPTGPADLIEDGENGFLTPVGDRAAMAAALRKAFEMPPEAKFAIGEKGRQTVMEKCSEKQIAEKMMAICDAIKKGKSV